MELPEENVSLSNQVTGRKRDGLTDGGEKTGLEDTEASGFPREVSMQPLGFILSEGQSVPWVSRMREMTG